MTEIEKLVWAAAYAGAFLEDIQRRQFAGESTRTLAAAQIEVGRAAAAVADLIVAAMPVERRKP